MNKHCGRFSLVLRSGVLLFSAAVGLGKLSADPITLDNDADSYGVDQSYVNAQAGGNLGTTVDVNSFPYVTPTSDSDSNDDSATLTNDLTTSGLNFVFSEVSGTVPPGQDASAQSIIYFQAGSNVTYSITGSITLGGGHSGAIFASLQDMTQGGYLYLSGGQVGPAPGSIVLGTDTSAGRSPSGSLTAGDVYAFSVSETVTSSADEGGSITGNIGISFAQSASEPPTSAPTDTPTMPPWALVALALLLVASASRYLPQAAIKT